MTSTYAIVWGWAGVDGAGIVFPRNEIHFYEGDNSTEMTVKLWQQLKLLFYMHDLLFCSNYSPRLYRT